MKRTLRTALALCLLFLAPVARGAGSLDVATIRTGEAAASNVTITNFNVPADTPANAVLMACVGGTATNGAGDVSWNAQSFSIAVSELQGAVSAEVWYLLDPTPNTTDDLVVTPNGTGNYAVIAAVIENVGDNESSGSATGTGTSVSGSLTTVTADAFVVDCLVAAGSTSNPATTQAGQTERQQFNPTITTPILAVSDKQGPSTPGSTNLGWNGLQNATRTVQALAAFPNEAPPQATKDIIEPGVNPGPR